MQGTFGHYTQWATVFLIIFVLFTLFVRTTKSRPKNRRKRTICPLPEAGPQPSFSRRGSAAPYNPPLARQLLGKGGAHGPSRTDPRSLSGVVSSRHARRRWVLV